MSGEGSRSREAVRNSVRTYGVKVMDPAALPLRKTREKESQESVSRFSERSLHSQYEIREGSFKACLQRIPYATLLATILCVMGLLIQGLSSQRLGVITSGMVQEIFKHDSVLIRDTDLAFFAVEIATGILAALILVIGILATGDTRAKVYSKWQSRIGGRVCCAFLMFLAFVLFFVWLTMQWIMATMFFLVLIAQYQCDDFSKAGGNKECVPVPYLSYVFGDRTKAPLEICHLQDIKRFCKDYIEKVTSTYLIGNVGTMIVVFSLILFLVCLAANYARIRCQSKFQEIEELRHLELDLHSSKDRF